jgi:hypothetical protein
MRWNGRLRDLIFIFLGSSVMVARGTMVRQETITVFRIRRQSCAGIIARNFDIYKQVYIVGKSYILNKAIHEAEHITKKGKSMMSRKFQHSQQSL